MKRAFFLRWIIRRSLGTLHINDLIPCISQFYCVCTISIGASIRHILFHWYPITQYDIDKAFEWNSLDSPATTHSLRVSCLAPVRYHGLPSQSHRFLSTPTSHHLVLHLWVSLSTHTLHSLSSSSIDLLAASIDHLATLIVGISPALYTLDHPDPQLQSLWFCKIRGYLFQICLMLSRWFVAFACIDRCALSSEQVRFRHLATRRNAYRVIVVVIVFWSLVCSHRLIFFEIKGDLCAILSNLGAALYHSLYVIIGGGVLPSLIMIVCACMIRRNLVRKQQRRIQLLTTKERQRNALDQQVHRLLFIQIVFYIVFTSPQLANLTFHVVSIRVVDPSEDYLSIQQFVAFAAELMLYLFPVTSFYLYTLTSRSFRSELAKFCRIWFCRGARANHQVGDVSLNQHYWHKTNVLNKSDEVLAKQRPSCTLLVSFIQVKGSWNRRAASFDGVASTMEHTYSPFRYGWWWSCEHEFQIRFGDNQSAETSSRTTRYFLKRNSTLMIRSIANINFLGFL